MREHLYKWQNHFIMNIFELLSNSRANMVKREVTFDPVHKIWSGRRTPPLLNANSSFSQLLLQRIDQNLDQIAQISDDSGIVYTYRDIKTRAIRTVQFYHQQGLKEGDILGIAAANSSNLAPLALGGFLCGVSFNSLDITFGKPEIMHMYRKTKPKIVFCDEANYTNVKESLSEIGLLSPIYIVDGQVKGENHVNGFINDHKLDIENFQLPKLGDPTQNSATILCSSGTTGLPKGVLTSYATMTLFLDLFELIPGDDILLGFSTLYWFSGIYMLMLNLMSGTTRIITTEKYSSSLFLRLVEKYKVTFCLTPPSQIALLLQDPNLTADKLASIKNYLCGGSKVAKSLVDRTNSFLPNGRVNIVYGMTEFGMVSCDGSVGEIDSVGFLIPNVQAKIINESGEAVDPEIDGEILVKSPYRFLGYYQQPNETQAIYDQDGWIHSGDVGHFTTEGELVLVDRKKDILKFRNYHYFPSEIEQVLTEMPGIAEVCVCGIPQLDGSDLPAAYIVKAKGFQISESEVIDFVAKRLSDYKHLRGGVYFANAIPMTASGKYRRQVVREIVIGLHDKNKG